ncbi:hypothetical protein [Cupriavidus basilensis]|uniref:hypothetical protein n=1 Tax=Cupriavidus basilensis TaxID=68895 RepID=UPI000B071164|nr:hypothetical protein [Cupriavidus basilensis]
MTTAPTVPASRHEGRAELTLNRPETRNAIDMATAQALATPGARGACSRHAGNVPA